MARALFIAVPAVVIAAPIALFDPVFAGVFGVCVAVVGFSATVESSGR